jgi:hypothetical protein
LFQSGYHLAALRVEVEDFAVIVFVGQEVALHASLALFLILLGLVDPLAASVFQVRPDHLRGLRPPSARPNTLPGGLGRKVVAEQIGQIRTNRLHVLPAMLAVARLHDDAWLVAVELKRFGR